MKRLQRERSVFNILFFLSATGKPLTAFTLAKFWFVFGKKWYTGSLYKSQKPTLINFWGDKISVTGKILANKLSVEISTERL